MPRAYNNWELLYFLLSGEGLCWWLQTVLGCWPRPNTSTNRSLGQASSPSWISLLERSSKSARSKKSLSITFSKSDVVILLSTVCASSGCYSLRSRFISSIFTASRSSLKTDSNRLLCILLIFSTLGEGSIDFTRRPNAVFLLDFTLFLFISCPFVLPQYFLGVLWFLLQPTLFFTEKVRDCKCLAFIFLYRGSIFLKSYFASFLFFLYQWNQHGAFRAVL